MGKASLRRLSRHSSLQTWKNKETARKKKEGTACRAPTTSRRTRPREKCSKSFEKQLNGGEVRGVCERRTGSKARVVTRQTRRRARNPRCGAHGALVSKQQVQ